MNTKSTTAEDVFTSFYEAFHKLEQLAPGDTQEELETAQKQVEADLKECSHLLERYVDVRVKRIIKKMINDGLLKND